MSKVGIFVIAHKPFEKITDEGYKILQVGNNDLFGDYRDNTGDNIAEKNLYYCELTGLYWGWKNCKEYDVMGIVHYRRYFVSRSIKAFSPAQDILTKEQIEKILKKKKVILKYPGYKSINSSILYRGVPEENQKIVLIQLRNIIKDIFPKYLDSFDNIAYGYRIHHSNMFITSRSVYCDYCNWLFQVLNEFEDRYKKGGIEILDRQCGYVGEYMLGVYMHTNFEEEDLFYCDSILVDEKTNKKSIVYWAKNVIRSIFPKLSLNYKKLRAKNKFVKLRRANNLIVEEDILNGQIYSI